MRRRKRKRVESESDSDEDEDEDEDEIMEEKINPIINLCEEGKYEELRVLFEDETYGINEIDLETGMNGLMIAARYGHERVCRILISHEIKLNVKDKNGNTELHHAVLAVKPNLFVIKMMIRYGSCRFLQNNSKQMPFTIKIKNKLINDFIKNEPMTIFEAIIMRDYDMVKKYLEHDGYVITHKDNSGRDLLQILQEVEGKRTDVTKLSKLILGSL